MSSAEVLTAFFERGGQKLFLYLKSDPLIHSVCA